MLRSLSICALTLIASGNAMAQAGPVAKVTSDQLVCQLSGDCAKPDTSEAAMQDKPESRGFSIAKHTGSAPATQGAPNAAQLASQAQHKPAANATHYSAPRASAPSGPVGRVDLSITFVSGSAELTPAGKELANTFLQALRSPQLSGKRFMIGGHTDAVGSRPYNLDLSQRRAQALVDFLADQGIARSQFEVKGFGFDRPLPGSSGKAPGNRRVEVVKLN
jgi:OmpA-OmpF porin, OOP family